MILYFTLHDTIMLINFRGSSCGGNIMVGLIMLRGSVFSNEHSNTYVEISNFYLGMYMCIYTHISLKNKKKTYCVSRLPNMHYL